MGRATFTPGEVWLRTVRSGLRAWIRESGQVPSLMCAVSHSPGSSPRRARFSMRLDMLEDRLAVQALVQEQVRVHGSGFAAFGGITNDRARFALVVVTGAGGVVWSAPVDARSGLGGWVRDATVDVPGGWEFVRKAIEEARADG